MYTGYFGMQSPVCRGPLEGLRLPTAITEHVFCDPWGDELSAARLPVETYTPCHDALRKLPGLDETTKILDSAPGIVSRIQIGPGGIQTAVLVRQGAEWTRRRRRTQPPTGDAVPSLRFRSGQTS